MAVNDPSIGAVLGGKGGNRVDGDEASSVELIREGRTEGQCGEISVWSLMLGSGEVTVDMEVFRKGAPFTRILFGLKGSEVDTSSDGVLSSVYRQITERLEFAVVEFCSRRVSSNLAC